MPPQDWSRLTVQVTTPLFNQEADRGARDLTGIRPPSLRGVMRFWFRALAGIVAGPDIPLLAGMEEEVFGSARQPSPLMIRIPAQPALSQQPLQDARSTRPGGWSAYLLGPRLVTTPPRTTEIVPYVPPGQAFDICLKARSHGPFTEATTALAIASLWLACAYGGIGARARRGFGGLRIAGTDGPLPAPWTPENILSPGLGHYEQITRLWPSGPIGDCVRLLGPLAERHGGRLALAQWKTPPPYPVLSRTHTLAGVSGGGTFTSWAAVAEYAGLQLRSFRRLYGVPRAALQALTSEPGAATDANSSRFPVGVLGLPVLNGFSEVNAYRGDQPLRRPSTLWLRPVGEADQWRLFSYAFCGQFLPGPQPPEVREARARGRGERKLTVTDDDITALATRWITTLASDGTFT